MSSALVRLIFLPLVALALAPIPTGVTVAASGDALAIATTAHPGSDAFIDEAVNEHGMDRDSVADVLADAAFQQRIADLIARPAESKPWYDYRPIFMTDQRLSEGVAARQGVQQFPGARRTASRVSFEAP